MQKCTVHICPQDGGAHVNLKISQNLQQVPVFRVGFRCKDFKLVKFKKDGGSNNTD